VAKRIVINFDPSKPQATRKSRRWLRILAIFAIFVVAAIGLASLGGFFWWRHYQSTPTYSLALLVDAAQRNDAQELGKRIDDDELAKNMMANVSQKAIARYGATMSATSQQQLDTAISSLPDLKQKIHDEVLQELKSFAATSEPKPFVFLLVSVPSLVKITTEGDLAKALSTVSNRNFDLTMRRDADRWKVIGFNDDAVVQRIVDSVMKELPAIGALDAYGPLFKIPGKSRKRRR
jgi:hypothetical protein